MTYKGETYTSPSEFPDELVGHIKEHPYDWDVYSPSGEGNDDEDGNIYIGNKNWFEYIYRTGTESDGFVCEEMDLSSESASDVLEAMINTAVWAIEGEDKDSMSIPDTGTFSSDDELEQYIRKIICAGPWDGSAANMFSMFSINGISRNEFVEAAMKMHKDGYELPAPVLETSFKDVIPKTRTDDDVQNPFAFVVFKLEPEAVYTMSKYFPGKLCIGGTDWDETKVFIAKDGKDAKAAEDFTLKCSLNDSDEKGYVDFEYEVASSDEKTVFIGGNGMVTVSDAMKVMKYYGQ